MKKLLFVFAGLIALIGSIFLIRPTVQSVLADPAPHLNETICHWDGKSGKYSHITIDINSIKDCGDANGHGDHDNDIIPSYTYLTCVYAGKNLDKLSWIDNNCAQPVVDQCSNISGVQATVPSGDYQLNGECFPTTAVCDDPKATNFGGTDGIFNSTTETADDSLCQYTAAGTCPTACGQPSSTVPDGKGGTISCDATVACPVTPTPTNTPNNGGGSPAGDGLSDHRSDGLSSCPSCTQAPHIQAVLGASTMAGTGTFENTVMNFMLVAGMIVLSLGGLSYAKEIKK